MIKELPGGTLYPYQVEALDSIEGWGGRSLVADEMGLGKTATALAWLYNHPELRPALIVCPAAIKLQWAQEITRWLGIPAEDIEIVKGTRLRPLERPLAIVNYDILGKRMSNLLDYRPKVVILDESHYVKEVKSKRSKVSATICQLPGVESVLALTGTPVVNRPKELWHQIQCVQSKMWPNFFRYAMRFCDPQRVETRWNPEKNIRDKAWDFSGASHLDELDKILREEVMVRRRKVEVMAQLPEIQSVTVPFEVDLTKYHQVRQEVRERLADLAESLRSERESITSLETGAKGIAIASRAERNSTVRLDGLVITEITRLKHEAALAKVDVALDWITNFIQTGEPLVVYVHHHDLGDAITDGLQKAGLPVPAPLDGRRSASWRRDNVTAFGDGAFPVIVCGLKSMGMGVDGLQRGASHVAMLEFGWSPTDHAQAVARLHRIGQDNAVTVHYLLAAGTIDERIAQLVDAKATVTSAVMGEMDDEGIIESVDLDLAESLLFSVMEEA